MMRRREFITLIGGAAVAWPLAARAQRGERVRRIGVLIPFAADDPAAQRRVLAFAQALAQPGWTESRNVRIEISFTNDLFVRTFWIVTHDIRNFNRRWKIINHTIKQRLNTFVFESSSTEYWECFELKSAFTKSYF